jgi:hypothetical protein
LVLKKEYWKAMKKEQRMALKSAEMKVTQLVVCSDERKVLLWDAMKDETLETRKVNCWDKMMELMWVQWKVLRKAEMMGDLMAESKAYHLAD